MCSKLVLILCLSTASSFQFSHRAPVYHKVQEHQQRKWSAINAGSHLSMALDGSYEITSDGPKSILTVNVGQTPVVFETGVIGRQAHGSVVVKCGETVLYSSACAEK
ncbi:unnamed protein product, partial [Heterosigma akashiwo]